MCMRVEFHQTKNGLSSFFASAMKPIASVVTSSSMVSIRFLVSGPVFSIFCVPSGLAHVWMHAARAELLAEGRILGVVLDSPARPRR